MLGIGDEALHGIDAARVRHRPHCDALLQTVAKLEAAGIFGETGEEFFVHRLLHIEARRRDADLSRIAILERRNGIRRLLGICVGKYHHRRVAAELHCGALHSFCGEGGQVLADRD